MQSMPRRPGDPLRVVCTDNGQHSEALLGLYWRMNDGSDRLTSRIRPDDSVIGPADHNAENPWVSTDSYEFRCRRCRRDLKRNVSTISKALRSAYADTRLTRFDISLFEKIMS